MFHFKFANKRYRVVNPVKFIIFALFLLIFMAGVIYSISIGVKSAYSAIIQDSPTNEVMVEEAEVSSELEIDEVQIIEPVEPTYEFIKGDVQIASFHQEHFIGELEKALAETIGQLDALEYKYKETIDIQRKEIQEELRIFDEYSYVLEHKLSDFTVDDIKMIEELTEEYGGIVDPHLWLALVELESSYNSNAKNPNSTASGWGQVLKSTGRWLYEDKLKLGVYDHSTMGIDKSVNARLSIYYLSMLIEETGNIQNALIRYNGNELGLRYPNIIDTKLKINAGSTLKQMQTQYVVMMNEEKDRAI